MIQPKVKKMNRFIIFITGNGIAGITLAPFGIYIKEKYLNNKFIINHEKIHWKQQLEMFVLFFYIWYLIEWFIRLFINVDAYRNLLFEQEAYTNEYDLFYLKKRKSFSWFKYIKKKK